MSTMFHIEVKNIVIIVLEPVRDGFWKRTAIPNLVVARSNACTIISPV